MDMPRNAKVCTHTAMSVQDNCMCDDCVRRREMNAQPSMIDRIAAQQKEHEDQFDIATAAAIQRGFGRWFDDTWTSARAKGALPNPFISSMFVFITTVLLKKFVGGFPAGMPNDHKEQAIADAKQMMIGYLDQIEAAAIKDLYAQKPQAKPESAKQTIILPKKGIIQ